MDIDLKEELPGQVRLTGEVDTEQSWPDMGMELYDVRWQGAEPDVGIFTAYAEDCSVDAWVGDAKFKNDHKGFIAALYEAIGGDIEETEEELGEMVGNRINNALQDMEQE